MAWCSRHSEIRKAISGRSTSTIILWTWYSVGFVLRIHVFAVFFNFDPQNRFTLRKTSGNPESSLWKGQPVSKVQTHDFPCFPWVSSGALGSRFGCWSADTETLGVQVMAAVVMAKCQEKRTVAWGKSRSTIGFLRIFDAVVHLLE